ncbi:acetylxylan esterase [Salinibacterium sp. SWN1162]|uniref:acetylxylan esterase n=1 Tax=Salinibacterium sp. SWN1162 TaxID=2792053 RepID=UPI0018CD7B66|nr:acetylxylan esterase [Salinibacterium sp. SWN1162]MBH0008395.1 acetylxylan esterase [Salinibacterium sp. SWN1162]
MLTDLTAIELDNYRSAQTEPNDFDQFWAETLEQTRSHDLGVTVRRVESPLRTIDIYDLRFAGYAGEPVAAWLRVPSGIEGPLPALVQFVGYGGGRGKAEENLLWSSAGFVHLQMDTRGQGSAWSAGDTPDPHDAGVHYPGFMTAGILDPQTYYYRRVFSDAVRAIEAVRSFDSVDAHRVGTFGGSQGGGISLAATALVGDLAASAAFVPFLCDFRRAVLRTDEMPYAEIARYLAVHRDRSDQVHSTLEYFDGVNFARRARTPMWFSAGLMDKICPPSSVYGAFHEYAGEKSMTLREYNGHEGGLIDDDLAALEFFRRSMGMS